jgi:hypothetical protein
VRCLHCDQKLPIWMRILGSHFCSGAHKKAYNGDRSRLIEAFHRTDHLIRLSSASPLVNGFSSCEPLSEELAGR